MSLHVDKKLKIESDSDSDSESDERDWDPEDDYMQDIASDIALEISLRQRLVEAVESRIAWALLLQESLQKDACDAPQILDFKDVALDALTAIGAPTEILFARDEPVPPIDTRRLSVSKKPRKKPTARAQPSKKGGKFLYILSPGSTIPRILRCPMCLRTDFSSLQGLFNHARGTHSLAWSSHDECVRQCACAVEELQGGDVDFMDLGAGAEVGTGGILPGLRSLFEQAVGEDELDFEGETALSRTLGYHADTPALASFLGREPIRRGVVVWDPEAVVDIDGFDKEGPRPKRRWRMPFSHRNVFREVSPAPPSEPLPEPASAASVLPPPSHAVAPVNGMPTASSRFHMVTRIVVVDRSLWIPADQRIGTDTHKWMISVDAPSYAHNITTLLQSLTVTGPAGSSRLTTAPPFVVLGTAAVPFLARLELAFNSPHVGGVPQKIVLEHWVELDRMQSAGVVHGEEQVVDVELDRGTLFRPAQRGYLPIYSRALWDMDLERERHMPVDNTSDVAPSEVGAGSAKDERKTRYAVPKVRMLGSWSSVLKKLVERFPLTLQDVKGGKPPSPALPYKLVATPAQFSALVMGRKKAVEWGRAMAMRDAYSDALLNGLTEDVTMLTTADIFSWLHANGYFPRGAATLKKEQDLQTLQTGFCRVCGLTYQLHAVVSQQSVKLESGLNLACHFTAHDWQLKRMPMIDVSRLLPRRQLPRSALTPSSTMIVPLNAPRLTTASEARGRDTSWDALAPALLVLSDPRLIFGVRALVSALALPSFRPPATPASSDLDLPHFPIDPALSVAEVQADVAPYALLSLLTKQFVRALVKTGLEIAARDRHRAMVQLDGRRRVFSERERGRRMLTPAHVLQGVVTRGCDWKDRLGTALLGCLARSGVPLMPMQQQRGGEASGSGVVPVVNGGGGVQEVRVKTEPTYQPVPPQV